jgi:peptide chain release factor 1
MPTGLVVECQDDRSQHRNKRPGHERPGGRLKDRELQQQHAAEASTRKSLIGSGDRSDRIRTYNFPQGRITDHRINLTLYKIDAMMDGEHDGIARCAGGRASRRNCWRRVG